MQNTHFNPIAGSNVVDGNLYAHTQPFTQPIIQPIVNKVQPNQLLNPTIQPVKVQAPQNNVSAGQPPFGPDYGQTTSQSTPFVPTQASNKLANIADPTNVSKPVQTNLTSNNLLDNKMQSTMSQAINVNPSTNLTNAHLTQQGFQSSQSNFVEAAVQQSDSSSTFGGNEYSSMAPVKSNVATTVNFNTSNILNPAPSTQTPLINTTQLPNPIINNPNPYQAQQTLNVNIANTAAGQATTTISGFNQASPKDHSLSAKPATASTAPHSSAAILDQTTATLSEIIGDSDFSNENEEKSM